MGYVRVSGEAVSSSKSLQLENEKSVRGTVDVPLKKDKSGLCHTSKVRTEIESSPRIDLAMQQKNAL